MRLSSSLLLLQGAVAFAHESVAVVTATEPETIIKCTTYVTQEVITYITTLYSYGTHGTVSTPNGEPASSSPGHQESSNSLPVYTNPMEFTSSSTSYPPNTETHKRQSIPQISTSAWKFHNTSSTSSTTPLSSVFTSGSLTTPQNSISPTSTYISQSTGCPLDACATEVRSHLDNCSSFFQITFYPFTVTMTAYITMSNSSSFFTTPTSTEANDGANSAPGGTSITAIDAATDLCGFDYDETYSNTFQDYFIIRISDSDQACTMFWDLLNNFQFTPGGGCQTELSPRDSILWAYDAFNKDAFLNVSPSTVSLSLGGFEVFTVTDGSTGTPAAGAIFNGITANEDDQVIYFATQIGSFRLKATRSDAIRSPAVVTTVS